MNINITRKKYILIYKQLGLQTCFDIMNNPNMKMLFMHFVSSLRVLAIEELQTILARLLYLSLTSAVQSATSVWIFVSRWDCGYFIRSADLISDLQPWDDLPIRRTPLDETSPSVHGDVPAAWSMRLQPQFRGPANRSLYKHDVSPQHLGSTELPYSRLVLRYRRKQLDRQISRKRDAPILPECGSTSRDHQWQSCQLVPLALLVRVRSDLSYRHHRYGNLLVSQDVRSSRGMGSYDAPQSI